MYYIKKFIITSQNEAGEKIGSIVELAPGLNIIYGPSNTGKTLILDCVDFMLGGEARRLYKPALRIMAVTMLLDVDGAEFGVGVFLGGIGPRRTTSLLSARLQDLKPGLTQRDQRRKIKTQSVPCGSNSWG